MRIKNPEKQYESKCFQDAFMAAGGAIVGPGLSAKTIASAPKTSTQAEDCGSRASQFL
jgi:hypothetical protein